MDIDSENERLRGGKVGRSLSVAEPKFGWEADLGDCHSISGGTWAGEATGASCNVGAAQTSGVEPSGGSGASGA